MFNKNFYPTPKDLIDRMLSKIYYVNGMNFLEPSAGKGDIAEAITDMIGAKTAGWHPNNDAFKARIDTIEISEELQATLKGKGYRVIHNDFLSFENYQTYDAIVMNPPFDNGVDHLLKALELQRRGGQIVCLLNAETIKNPFSNKRVDLLQKLEEYDAEIEYLEGAFSNAERTTNVEVALIYVNIEYNYKDTLIFDTLKNEKEIEGLDFTEDNQIITADPMESAIQQYNLEVEAGIKLIYNYFDLVPLMQNTLNDSYKTTLLKLSINGERNITETNRGIINDYVEGVRYKYWSALINMDKFSQLLTSDLRDELRNKLDELKQYEFSKFNIEQVIKEITLNMTDSVVDTIIDLFDDLTYRYTYNDYSGNIHLYNGWKTNQGYKINDKKIIIPLSGYSDWNSYRTPYFSVGTEQKIRDMQKSLEYLEGGETKGYDNIREILKQAEEENNDFVEFKYFKIKFYKKGTAHVHWKDKNLVKKFNIFAGREKGWLPNEYGTKAYSDLTEEEKRVVNEFEGKESYKKTVKDAQYYLARPDVSNLMLM